MCYKSLHLPRGRKKGPRSPVFERYTGDAWARGKARLTAGDRSSHLEAAKSAVGQQHRQGAVVIQVRPVNSVFIRFVAQSGGTMLLVSGNQVIDWRFTWN